MGKYLSEQDKIAMVLVMLVLLQVVFGLIAYCTGGE